MSPLELFPPQNPGVLYSDLLLTSFLVWIGVWIHHKFGNFIYHGLILAV